MTETILAYIADPNIAYLLLMLGIYGIVIEVNNPGTTIPGVVGVACLILSLMALSAMPTDWLSVAQIGLGVLLLSLEIWVAAYGALALAGILLIAFGSQQLFLEDSPYQVSIWLTAATVLVGAFLSFVVGYFAMKAYHAPKKALIDTIVGETGEVISTRKRGGYWVRVQGERWHGVTENDLSIKPGEPVQVISKRGLILIIKPVAQCGAEELS